jgi:DnaJ-class molecular chaperone
MTYSDSEIKPEQCPACGGSGERNFKPCGRCQESGKIYPLRRNKLAEAFSEGRLPEQPSPPGHRWCEACRPNGRFKRDHNGINLSNTCKACDGRSIIKT